MIEYRDIDGFPGYKISIDGTVIGKRGKKLKYGINKNGYCLFVFIKDGVRYNKMLHRLLMEAFVENINNLPCINHIDGNKLNNNISNLEYISYSDNTKHSYRMGLQLKQFGEQTSNNKLTESDVIEIRNLINSGKSCNSIATMYGVRCHAITDIKHGRTWGWLLDEC